MNAREQLEAAQNWLAWQHEGMSDGLRSANDGLRLWQYAMAHPELPEFLDTPDCAKCRRDALGYDPLSPQEQTRTREEI